MSTSIPPVLEEALSALGWQHRTQQEQPQQCDAVNDRGACCALDVGHGSILVQWPHVTTLGNLFAEQFVPAEV